MIKLGQQQEWTKSSHSGGNGACVEVRSDRPATVSVTDSKVADTTARPVFSVSPSAFAALIEHVRA